MLLGMSQSFKTPNGNAGLIPSYYGLHHDKQLTATQILNLQFRGTVPGNPFEEITLGNTYYDTEFNDWTEFSNYQWFAYPMVYGPCEFYDLDSGFTGGWDGAIYEPFSGDQLFGPKVMPIPVNGQDVLFYVYRSDWYDLGICHWRVQPYQG